MPDGCCDTKNVSLQASDMKILYDVVDSGAKKYGDKPALVSASGEIVSYSELLERVHRKMAYYAFLGVERRHNVAIYAPNSPEWAISYLALASMGVTAVPILANHSPSSVANIVNTAEVGHVITTGELYSYLKNGVNGLAVYKLMYTAFFDINGTDDKGEERVPDAFPEEDDPAIMVFTSGTTGNAKGVLLSHKNILSNIKATNEIVNVSEKDRMLSILPLPHAYENINGLVLPLMFGATVYYTHSLPTEYNLRVSCQEVKPTIILCVPLIVEKLTKSLLSKCESGSDDKTLSSLLAETLGKDLRLLNFAGAHLPKEIDRFLCSTKFPFAVGYGLTETSTVISYTSVFDNKFGSAGKIMKTYEYKFDEETGELLVKSPSILLGYYKDEEKTKEVFTEDGFFKTGDVGHVDEEGYLFIKGRIKNVIIRSDGNNIYPEEIERMLTADPVLDALVYLKEGRLVARVYLDPEKTKTLSTEELEAVVEGIRQDANRKLSAYERIMQIFVQKEPFEKNVTNKIIRRLYL